MTAAVILAAAIPYTVQALVAAVLIAYAWYWTAHNVAVEEIRETGPRPSLRAAINAKPDEELAARYWELRAAADRKAAA